MHCSYLQLKPIMQAVETKAVEEPHFSMHLFNMSNSCFQFSALLLCLVSGMCVNAQNFIGPVVETADLGFTAGGRWSREKRCPPGLVITAYAIRYDQRRSDEGKVMVALEAHCSTLNAKEEASEAVRVLTIKATNLQSSRDGHGQFSAVVNSSTYAIGFTMQTWIGSGGDRADIGGHQFTFQDESSVQAIFPADSTMKRVEQYLCAEGYGICSVQGKIKAGKGPHPSQITRLRFRCCYYCQAEEHVETVLDAVNRGNTEQNFTYRTTSGTQMAPSRGLSNSKIGKRNGRILQVTGLTGAESAQTDGNASRESSVTKGTSSAAWHRQAQQQTTQFQNGSIYGVETSVTMQWDTLRGTEDARESIGTTSPDDFLQNGESSIGISIMLEQTAPANKQLSIEKSMLEGAQELFRSSYNQGRTRGYNWTETSSELWHQEVEKTVTISCVPMTSCHFAQIVGTCGPLVVRTTKVQRRNTHLRPLFSDAAQAQARDSSDPDAVLNITSADGMWIVARNISFWPASKKWEPFITCPEGAFVLGHQHSFVFLRGWKLINGYRLICSEINHGSSIHKPVQIQSPNLAQLGMWTDVVVHGEGQWARGYRVVRMVVNGTSFVGNHELIYADVKAKPIPEDGASTVDEVLCPPMHAVCGLSTMLDAHGRGLITNVALKCCFHCQPQEHFLNKLTVENPSPETSTHSITFTMGKQNINANAQSSSNEISLIRRDFETKIGKLAHSDFDWSQTQDSLWTEGSRNSVNFYCPPYHECSYKQLVGHCGPNQFLTPKFKILAIPMSQSVFEGPLDFMFRLKTPPSRLVVDGGHIFLIFTILNDCLVKKGDWEPLNNCPAGCVATDINVKLQEDDGFQITGISLQCSRLVPYTNNGSNYMDYVRLRVETPKGAGEWVEGLGPDGQAPVDGFYFHQKHASSDDGLDDDDNDGFEFSAGPLFDRSASKIYKMAKSCPPNYQICGFQYRMDEQSRAITDIKFRCCPHCIPREEWRSISTLTYADDALQHLTVKIKYGIAERHMPIILSHAGSANQTLYALMGVPILETLFTHRFPHVSPNGFEWSSTSSSFWGGVRKSMDVYTCGPYSRCMYMQLHGVCGPIEVPTPPRHVWRERVDPPPI